MHYDSPLDDRNQTIDVTLEKKNFKKAVETLAQIGGETVMDESPTVAQYIMI